MKKLYVAALLFTSLYSKADLIDFTGGVAYRTDGSSYVTDNTNHDFEDIDYYTQNGYKFDFVDNSDPFDTSVGNYFDNGTDVFHGHAPGLTEIRVSAVNGSNFTANSFRLTTHAGESWAVNAVASDNTIKATQQLPQEEWGAGVNQGTNPIITLGDQFQNVKEISFTANNGAFGIGFDDFNFVQKYLAPEEGVKLAPTLTIIDNAIKDKAEKLQKQAENTVLGYVDNPANLAKDFEEFIVGVGTGELNGAASKLATHLLLSITKHPYFKNTAITSINHAAVSKQLTAQFTKLNFKGVSKNVATSMLINVLTTVIDSHYGHKVAGASWFAMKEIVAGVNAGITAKNTKMPYAIAFAYEQTGVLIDAVTKAVVEYGNAEDIGEHLAYSRITAEINSFILEQSQDQGLYQDYYQATTQFEKAIILAQIKNEIRNEISNYIESIGFVDEFFADYSEVAIELLEKYDIRLEGGLILSKLEIEANILAFIASNQFDEALELSIRTTGSSLFYDEAKSVLDLAFKIENDANSVPSSETKPKEVAEEQPTPILDINFDDDGALTGQGSLVSDSFSVNGTAFFENDVLVLQTHSPTLVFFDLLIPDDAVSLTFDFLSTNTVLDDLLTFMIGDELLFSLDGSEFGTDWMQTGLLDISKFAGKNETLSFGLLSPDGIESELYIDNIQFYKTSVSNGSPVDVPEPSTLILFILGVILCYRFRNSNEGETLKHEYSLSGNNYYA